MRARSWIAWAATLTVVCGIYYRFSTASQEDLLRYQKRKAVDDRIASTELPAEQLRSSVTKQFWIQDKEKGSLPCYLTSPSSELQLIARGSKFEANERLKLVEGSLEGLLLRAGELSYHGKDLLLSEGARLEFPEGVLEAETVSLTQEAGGLKAELSSGPMQRVSGLMLPKKEGDSSYSFESGQAELTGSLKEIKQLTLSQEVLLRAKSVSEGGWDALLTTPLCLLNPLAGTGSCEDAHGQFTSADQRIYLYSEQMSWDEESSILQLKGHSELQQEGGGTLRSQGLIQIQRAGNLIDTIVAEGLTQLKWEQQGSPLLYRLVSHGKMEFEREGGRGRLTSPSRDPEQLIYFEAAGLEIYGEEAFLRFSLENGKPEKILLEGSVRILQRESGVVARYAVADELVYDAELGEMRLRSMTGSPVLCYDPRDGSSLSASEMVVQIAPAGPRIEGRGTVRMQLQPSERETIKNIFNIDL